MRPENNLLSIVKKEDNFSFANHTTYGLGGLAKTAFYPKSLEEASAVYDYVVENYKKFVIIGNGSNLLVSNGYYDGAVISTKLLTDIRAKGNSLITQSGVTVNALLSYCLENNLGGLEYLTGIPATLGGLMCMNGGVNGRHVADDVEYVVIYDGKLRKLSNEDCNFSVKHSTMRDNNALVLEICWKINPYSEQSEIQNIYKKYADIRKIQPKGKSCGCVFKNPDGASAGKLIDEAGLKGFKIGNAEVSCAHANFIINNGNNPQDVYRLIKHVQKTVFEKTGILLSEEVVYIGEFNDSDS